MFGVSEIICNFADEFKIYLVMAQIELRLSNKIQKETGMSEVMICFRFTKHDLSARSGIFVNPAFFEYYVDRKKTINPKRPLPENKTTTTLEKAVKNGWAVRKSGIIATSAKAIQTKEVEEHNKKAGQMEDLKKAIISAYNDAAEKESLTSIWLQGVVDKYHHPEKYDVSLRPKTFAELAEEYYTIPHGGRLTPLSNDQQRAYKVLIRTVARFEGYIQFKKDKMFRFDVNTVTRKDIEEFAEYLKNEKELAEAYPSLFRHLMDKYPLAIGGGHNPLQGRGENTVKNMLDRLKSLFRYFVEKGYTTNQPFTGYKIGAEQYGTPVYITIEERNRIADADLESIWGNMSIEERRTARMPLKTLMIMRDIFIGQCFIGCRVGDLAHLTEQHIVDGVLRYTPNKTLAESGESATVPLHPKVLALIEKYRGVDKKGRLFPVISPNKYNIAIKVIFRMAGVTRPVEITNPKTGRKEVVTIDTVASSHMARRTFIGNSYFMVSDPNLISKMSGHVEGSKAFSRYRKIEVETLKGIIDKLG